MDILVYLPIDPHADGQQEQVKEDDDDSWSQEGIEVVRWGGAGGDEGVVVIGVTGETGVGGVVVVVVVGAILAVEGAG